MALIVRKILLLQLAVFFLLGSARGIYNVTFIRHSIRSYRVRVPLRPPHVPRVFVMSINSSQSDLRKSFSTNSRATGAIAFGDYVDNRRLIALAWSVVDCGCRHIKSSYSPATESTRNLLIKRLTSWGERKGERGGGGSMRCADSIIVSAVWPTRVKYAIKR